ncbi:undecaprenyl-diphosphatase [Candidatus Gottesmanbacteria bacterium RIFCSPLOWO2_01_FULL_43_11b]|uniref:Undecaprenyl-diphosphatase n=1 Tax=Candidatus Gottesmanbacteria bacterium RIFCSPLOWO2_01_FULL_43_11b TaxID=1798392 RepID=A0A1F6AH78_9BACT|nr:MAG: undecaprenyl-diphosphatase [Candidatus Gottesmanbacteria bacterium RIFCSPLOWO2_01_FULL_43_11b]
MSSFQAIVLSIIEGITEFLPVSSTGHLILASKLLHIQPTEFTKSFEIFIQLGAIMAVATLYGRVLLINRKLWLPLISAFIPTAIVGFTFYPLIKTYLLESTTITTISLFVGGFVLIFFERIGFKKDKTLTWQNAIIIGLCQSVSIIPGVSRAAATIVGGLAIGLPRKEAVEFSFLLALPTMAAASGLDLIKSAGNFTQSELWILVVGFIGAWVVAHVTIKAFLRFIKTNTFTSFGVYRILLALIFWLLYR